MKTLFVAMMACMLGTSAFAQDSEQQDTTRRKTQQEYYMMRDGTVWYYMDTTSTRVTRDITLKNGVIITSRGEIISKDGRRTTVTNGQCIDLTGTIGKCDIYQRPKREPGDGDE
jgi:hypothetical protein